MDIDLSELEAADVSALLDDICRRYQTADDPDFLRRCSAVARHLPARLVEEMEDWRLTERHAICVVHGLPVIDSQLGATPAHWRDAAREGRGKREEVLLVLLSSVVGDVFGWATQQDGRLVHDVLPIKDHEYDQLGSGSKELLWWHTEDAFHPLRGDYLALLCLRNPDDAATTVSTVHDLGLAALDTEVLFEPHFFIRPDESHLPKNNSMSSVDPFFIAASETITAMIETQPRVSVLFGDRSDPYLRLDPYFMDEPADRRAAGALSALVKQLDEGLRDVVLRPGDCIIINNHRAVHGRKPFAARFDGTDRWLKRTNVTRDLRKSRAVRRSPSDRIVH